MQIELRLEQPKDYRETENLVREAFWNHYSPGCNENYLLHIMRNCPAFVPELAIVAVYDGRIAGNIVYVKAVLAGADGKKYQVLSLGPIGVLPEFQRQGIFPAEGLRNKNFPQKEVVTGTSSQKRFEEIVVMVKDAG